MDLVWIVAIAVRQAAGANEPLLLIEPQSVPADACCGCKLANSHGAQDCA